MHTRTKKRYMIYFTTIFVLTLFLLPSLIPPAKADLLNTKKTVRVAFIWQRWDILDIPAKIGMMIYRNILREAEKEYNVEFEIYEFWDRWNGGDVQSGKLEKHNIDVIVGPGGFGGWNTPKKYRTEIRKFVRNGGGFYGICGDSTFGSLGVVNLPQGYRIPLKKATGSGKLTPMLGLANVYTDASAFDHILQFPLWIKKRDVILTAGQLPISRAPIKIEQSFLPIQEPYSNDRIRMMLGNAPLVDGPILLRFFMSKVYTLAIFKGTDDPYDETLKGKKAIVATWYGKGRVILSVVHPELTIGNSKAHDVFVRNLLWTAQSLPLKEKITNSLPLLLTLINSKDVEHPLIWYFLLTFDY